MRYRLCNVHPFGFLCQAIGPHPKNVLWKYCTGTHWLHHIVCSCSTTHCLNRTCHYRALTDSSGQKECPIVYLTQVAGKQPYQLAFFCFLQMMAPKYPGKNSSHLLYLLSLATAGATHLTPSVTCRATHYECCLSVTFLVSHHSRGSQGRRATGEGSSRGGRRHPASRLLAFLRLTLASESTDWRQREQGDGEREFSLVILPFCNYPTIFLKI